MTVVTVQGGEAPGVTIETDPEKFAVQIRDPSKAIPTVPFPRLLATVVTAPAAWRGSIRKSCPELEFPVTKTRPIATSTPYAANAPVHVSSSLPSLPRTRETVPPPPKFATHRSAPSDSTSLGVLPTAVSPRTPLLWGVQNCFKAARRPPGCSVRSPVRDKTAAICGRGTLPAGS